MQTSFMGCTRTARLIRAFQNSCSYDDDVREEYILLRRNVGGPHSKNKLINVT